jgi:hypothetical protein
MHIRIRFGSSASCLALDESLAEHYLFQAFNTCINIEGDNSSTLLIGCYSGVNSNGQTAEVSTHTTYTQQWCEGTATPSVPNYLSVCSLHEDAGAELGYLNEYCYGGGSGHHKRYYN